MMISFYRRQRKNWFLFLSSPKPNVWEKGHSAGNRWSGWWLYQNVTHLPVRVDTLTWPYPCSRDRHRPYRSRGHGFINMGAWHRNPRQVLNHNKGHTSGTLAALSLCSCGCSVLPHKSHTYVFNPSPLIPAMQRWGLGALLSFSSQTSKSPRYWGHFLGGDTLGTRQKRFILQ